MPLMISPQTSAKLVGGHGTSIAHMLAMALNDLSMDDDLRETLTAHEIVLGDERAGGRHVLAWSVPLKVMSVWNNCRGPGT